MQSFKEDKECDFVADEVECMSIRLIESMLIDSFFAGLKYAAVK